MPLSPKARSRLLAGALLLLVLCSGGVYLIARAYNNYLKQPPRSERPHIYVMPQPLPLEPCTLDPLTNVTFAGYSFDVPWAVADSTELGAQRDVLRVDFASGQVMAVSDLDELLRALEGLRKEDAQTREYIETMWGPQALESHYGFIRVVMETTPSDVTIFVHPMRAFGTKKLLTLKDELASNAATGLYTFEAGNIRGFQFGDPSQATEVEVILFDPSDRALNLLVRPGRDPAGRISQLDMSCILQSVRPADEPHK